MALGSAVARKSAMLLTSEPAQLHEISLVTRRIESGSSCFSQARASGLTGFPDNESGNSLRAIASAASARAGDGSIYVTSAAAAIASLSATPLTTPATALLRLSPERFSWHQLRAEAGSCLPQTSTNAGLMRLRVNESAETSHSAAALRSRLDHSLRAASPRVRPRS